MHKKTIVTSIIVMLMMLIGLMDLPGTANAQEPEGEQQAAAGAQQQAAEQSHAVNDEVADTPLEIHGLHHGEGLTDGPRPEGQHGGPGGHLPGSSANVELVGQVTVSNIEPGLISDVGTLGNFAYLGAFGGAFCDKAGVYVIDISDPTNPQEVNFIPTKPGSFVGEGVQVIPIRTEFFRGDLLVMNNEICAITGEQIGGVSLFDVTDPLNPVTLVEGAGDTDPGGIAADANQIHSAFAWQQGRKAYVVIVDDEELLDVDILDITDPTNPVHIAETGLPDWPDAQSPLANGDTTFFHDVVVKRIQGHWLMLLSYWDAGWVILNVDDPANPVFVNDFDYLDPDPLVPGVSPAEGNAHQAEWSHNSRFIIGTDEDFSPERLTTFQITSGPNAGEYLGGIFGFGKSIATLDDDTLNGPTVFGGYGCNDDLADIPDASVLTLDPGEESVLVVSRGPVNDPNHPHGACRFDEKAQNAIDKGYDAVIIGNHHNGAGGGAFPDAALCGGGDNRDIFVLCTGHRAMHLLFNTTPDFTIPYPLLPNNEPVPGTLGAEVFAQAQFDAWGYVHLIDAQTLEEIDSYAIAESLDVAFSDDFGDLSVHEVAVDPEENLGYLSYYAGGFRVIKFSKKHGIQEVGHFIDENGNNFWGVQIHQPRDDEGEDRPLVLASDRDSGLWIFRYTGDD